jgi:hypothetical protein
MSCLVSCFILEQQHLTFLFSADFSEDDGDYDSNASEQEDITLGLHDTDIDDEEFEDIEHEGTMPPKSVVTKKNAVKKSPMEVLKEKLSKTTLKEKTGSTSFSISSPKLK